MTCVVPMDCFVACVSPILEALSVLCHHAHRGRFGWPEVFERTGASPGDAAFA